MAATDALRDVPAGVILTLAAIGSLWLARKVFSYVRLLLNLFVLTGTNLRKFGPKGSWAVVTGASDGLGKEFATQLAAKGFNLILVSRTQSKLDTVAQGIEQKYAGTKTKTLAMDFSQNNDKDYVKLADLLEGLDVAVLINNVGQGHSIPVSFLETDKEELENIIMTNCLGTLKTTQVVAPLLAQRKKGLILTMGSFAGWVPTAYLATYSGSKAFLQHWSSALAEELKSSNVHVELVQSHLVVSALSKVRRPTALVPLPRQFVRATLGKIGLGGTQSIAYTSTPYWAHGLYQWWIDNTVGLGNKLTLKINLNMHKDIRARALRKAAREAKKA